jgi:hypothetical protein
MAIQLSDSIFVGQQKPVDDKYYNGLSPYSSTSQVNTALASAIRYRGLTVNISGTEYWYKDGITDGDLVVKSSGGGGGAIEIQDEGSTIDSATAIINFTGAGVSASGPGTGTVTVNIPGVSAISYNNIDLGYGNYTMTQVGQYEVTRGSNTYKIIFPDPGSVNNGDIITIVNRDLSNGLEAPLNNENAEGNIFFQGGEPTVNPQGGGTSDILGKVKTIPNGMTYRFEAVQSTSSGQNYWMCHPMNIEPYYDDIVLFDDSSNTPYPLYIQNYGTYNIIKGTNADKENKFGIIYFPNPVNNIGKKITISLNFGITATLDNTYYIAHANYFPTGSGYIWPILELVGGTTYTFIAVPGRFYSTPYWSCINSHPPVSPIIGLDLAGRGDNVFMASSGIYTIFTTGTVGLEFVNPIHGTRMTIINQTANSVSFYGELVRRPENSTVSNIGAYQSMEIVCTNTGYRALYQS